MELDPAARPVDDARSVANLTEEPSLRTLLVILIGIAIELAYIGKAISVTNKRLSALLKHINP